MVVLPLLKGDSGEFLDQNRNEPGLQSYTHIFNQSGMKSGEMSGLSFAVGAVLYGKYAAVLDRDPSTGDALLKSYDLGDPTNPRLIHTIGVKGAPNRLLKLGRIPINVNVEASQTAASSWACYDLNILGVFTGGLGDEKTLTLLEYDQSGRFDKSSYYFPIPPSDPDNPPNPTTVIPPSPFLASSVISYDNFTQITRAKWEAPFIGMLEFSAERPALSLINMQAFVAGSQLYNVSGPLVISSEEESQQIVPPRSFRERRPLPPNGHPGIDANNNGFYCDQGEVPPLPRIGERLPLGLTFSWAPLDPNERLVDFDFNGQFALVGAITRLRDSRQTLYRTVLAGALGPIVAEQSVVLAESALPRQVKLFVGVPSPVPGSGPRDLAVVSFDGSPGFLRVVDITYPLEPEVLGEPIFLPPNAGGALSMEIRPDGLLAVAGATSVFLFDPQQLALPMEPNWKTHPSLVRILDGLGSATRQLVSDPSGLNIAAFGTSGVVLQAEPAFDFVYRENGVGEARKLRELALFSPKNFREDVLDHLRKPPVLETIDLNFTTESPPAPDPRRHYYVRMYAPGEAGATLPVCLVSAYKSGRTFRGSMLEGVPTVISDKDTNDRVLLGKFIQVTKSLITGIPFTLERLQKIKESAEKLKSGKDTLAELKTLAGLGLEIFTEFKKQYDIIKGYPGEITAYRMSDDASSDEFNLYLAGPFVLTAKQIELAKVNQLQGQLQRGVLLAGDQTWTGLAGTALSNPVVGIFSSELVPNLKTFNDASQRVSDWGDFVEGVGILRTAATGDLPGAGKNLLSAILGKFEQSLNGQLSPEMIPGAHARLQTNVRNRNPVIFLHGIMGSHLEYKGSAFPMLGEAWMWKTVGLGASPLALNEQGNSVNNIVPSDTIRRVPEEVDLSQIKKDWSNEVVYLDILQHLKIAGYAEYDYISDVLENAMNFEQRVSDTSTFSPQGLLNLVRDTEAAPFIASRMEERRRLNGSPRLGLNPPPTLFVFPYDWRVDNKISAQKLGEYLELIRAIHPDMEQVDIVCHSNGGLVAKQFINTHPGVVDQCISIGSPWLGSLMPLLALKTGDLNELSTNLLVPLKVMKELGAYMKSLHQLLPARGLFELSGSLVREAGHDINQDGDAYQNYSFAQYMDSLKTHALRDALEAVFTNATSRVAYTNHPAAQNWTDFHHQAYNNRDFGDWREDNTGVEYHHIIGFQVLPQTIGGVTFSSWFLPNTDPKATTALSTRSAEFRDSERERLLIEDPEGIRVFVDDESDFPETGRQFTFSPVLELSFIAGDGTVPLLSATRGFGSSKDMNAPGARVYPIVRTELNTMHEANHNGMLRSPDVLDLVTGILLEGRGQDISVAIQVPTTTVVEGSAVSFSGNAADGIHGWDFGDGGVHGVVGAGVPVSHTFAQDGEYIVSYGFQPADPKNPGKYLPGGYTSVKVTVANANPTVSIDGPDYILVGESGLYTTQISDPGVLDRHTFEWEIAGANYEGPVDLYLLRLNAEDIPLPEGSPPDATPPDERQLLVRCTVRDEAGGFATATKTVFIRRTPPASPSPPVTAGRPAAPPQEYGFPTVRLFVSGHEAAFYSLHGLDVQNSYVDGLFNQLIRLLQFVGNNPISGSDENSFFNQLKNVFVNTLAYLRGAVVATDVVVMDLPRPRSFDNLDALKTSFIGQTKAPRLSIRAEFREFGVVQRMERYEIDTTEPQKNFTFRWDWQTKTGEVVLPASSTLAEQVILDENEARDRVEPSVFGLIDAYSQNLYIFGFDSVSATDLNYYFAYDTNNNNVFTDEIWYELDKERLELHRSAMPTRPISVVARDRAGNISTAIPFIAKEVPNRALPLPPAKLEAIKQETCDKIAARKTLLKNFFSAAFGLPGVQNFLLSPNHVWLEEQGSGACLWKPNNTECSACINAGFKIESSDNDYHLFLPVRIKKPDPGSDNTQDFVPFATGDDEDRLDWLAKDQLQEYYLGNWYFLPPVLVNEDGDVLDFPKPEDPVAPNTKWRYTYPAGFWPDGNTTGFVDIPRAPRPPPKVQPNPAEGWSDPLTPGEAIALYMDNLRFIQEPFKSADPELEMTIFPARREHFMYGRWALDFSPDFGDDPVGDASMGRQMLAMKIVLESEILPTDGLPAGVNNPDVAPDYDLIYKNWQNVGIPIAEGFEWGMLQEFNYFQNGKPWIDVQKADLAATDSPVLDFIQASSKSSLKKIGKSCIRAALALMAGDPEQNARIVTHVPDRKDYNSKSFEDLIFEIAVASVQTGSNPFFLEGVNYATKIEFWLNLKKADKATIKQVLSSEDGYKNAVTDALAFLHAVQRKTLPTYQTYMDAALDSGNANRIEEYRRRSEAYGQVRCGRGKVIGLYQQNGMGIPPDKEYKYELMVAVHNHSEEDTITHSVAFSPGVGLGENQGPHTLIVPPKQIKEIPGEKPPVPFGQPPADPVPPPFKLIYPRSLTQTPFKSSSVFVPGSDDPLLNFSFKHRQLVFFPSLTVEPILFLPYTEIPRSTLRYTLGGGCPTPPSGENP
jgi:pimeloyl-ACP methyl ester carboxylesterase/PKD repeat protein